MKTDASKILFVNIVCQISLVILGAVVIYPHNIFMGIPTLTFYLLVGDAIGKYLFKK